MVYPHFLCNSIFFDDPKTQTPCCVLDGVLVACGNHRGAPFNQRRSESSPEKQPDLAHPIIIVIIIIIG
jgi:hypothetical protein